MLRLTDSIISVWEFYWALPHRCSRLSIRIHICKESSNFNIIDERIQYVRLKR